MESAAGTRRRRRALLSGPKILDRKTATTKGTRTGSSMRSTKPTATKARIPRKIRTSLLSRMWRTPRSLWLRSERPPASVTQARIGGSEAQG